MAHAALVRREDGWFEVAEKPDAAELARFYRDKYYGARDGRSQYAHGYTEEELKALRCEDLIHGDDRIANKIQQDRLLEGRISSFEIVSRYLSKKGNPLWGHRHISLLRDGANRPTNIMALVTDITKNKQ